MNEIERPKLFISYSHDSDEHRERVLGLSERLRQDGIDTILDQYVQGSPPEGWPRWMLNSLDDASHVICVCSENYYRRFRGKDEPDKGKGVDWEGAVITQALYDSKSQTNCILPVLYQPSDKDFIPEPLRGFNYYLLNSEQNYQALYDQILGQAGVTPGELGELKTKPRATGVPAVFGDGVKISRPPEKDVQTHADLPRTSPREEQLSSDALRAAYLGRRPVVVDAANNFHREVEDLVTESIPTAKVSHEVMDWGAFHQGARSNAYADPLKEVPHQVQLMIATESTGDAENVRELVDSNYTVVSDEWKDGVRSPERHLICLVPPQAMPEGFSVRVDVPTQVTIVIYINEHLPSPSSGEESRPLLVPHNPNAREPRALVMKGGGVKGLAYAGAIGLLQEQYEFDWFVGTSAGAIAATLLGAGYEIDELEVILREKDFTDFFDAKWFQKPLNLLMLRGIHRADAFTDWLDVLLAKKLNSHRRVKMSDLPYRATVYASQRGTRALKFDSIDNDADAAFAVRCSMSIPLVFTPQFNQGIRTFDGGIQNNFPVEELNKDYPDVEFISLYLGSEVYEPVKSNSILADLVSIVSESSDPGTVEEYRESTVIIDPRPVGTLDFALTNDEKNMLIKAGRVGALAHLRPDSQQHADEKVQLKELRTKVESTRKRARVRSRVVRAVCFISLLILTTLVIWYYFFSGASEHSYLPGDRELFGENFALVSKHDSSEAAEKIRDKLIELSNLTAKVSPPETSPLVGSSHVKIGFGEDQVVVARDPKLAGSYIVAIDPVSEKDDDPAIVNEEIRALRTCIYNLENELYHPASSQTPDVLRMKELLKELDQYLEEIERDFYHVHDYEKTYGVTVPSEYWSG